MVNPDLNFLSDPCQETIPEREFLNHLFLHVPYGQYLELTYILPPELVHVGPSPITHSYQIGKDRPDWQQVADMNARGYGVFYGLTTKDKPCQHGRRASEKNTATISALWAEIDMHDGYYETLEAAYYGLFALPMPPTVVIFSGGGFHALWRITPIAATPENSRKVKAVLKGLAQWVHGDPHVAELARVFRLPGTINTKPARNGALCEVVWWLPGEWNIADFEEYAVPERQPVHLPPPVTPLPLPRWVLDYTEHGAPQGERNNRLYAATIEYNANGLTFADAYRDLCGRALADGLDEHEIERTMKSAWESGRGAPNIDDRLKTRRARRNED